MKNRTIVPLLILFLISLSQGCSRSGSEGLSEAPLANQDALIKEDVNEIVKAFLGALRGGEEARIQRWMSPTAREICGKLKKTPGLEASDTTRFTIDRIVLVGTDQALVETTMIDTEEGSGETFEQPIGWALKLFEEGWRVVGTSFIYIDPEDPIVIDFESPEIISRVQMQVEQQEKRVFAEIQRMEAEQRATPPGTAAPDSSPSNVLPPQIGSSQTPGIQR